MKAKKKDAQEVEFAEEQTEKKRSLFVKFFIPVSSQEFQTNGYSDTKKYIIFQAISLSVLFLCLIVNVIGSSHMIKRNVGTLIPTYKIASETRIIDYSKDWDYYDNVTGEVRSNVDAPKPFARSAPCNGLPLLLE